MYQQQAEFPTVLDSDWSQVRVEEFVHPPLLLKRDPRKSSEKNRNDLDGHQQTRQTYQDVSGSLTGYRGEHNSE